MIFHAFLALWCHSGLVSEAVKEEKGICCTRLDEQGREICFEDEAQFDILLGVALGGLVTMAVVGCLRQAHLRGPGPRKTWAKPRKKNEKDMEKPGKCV